MQQTESRSNSSSEIRLLTPSLSKHSFPLPQITLYGVGLKFSGSLRLTSFENSLWISSIDLRSCSSFNSTLDDIVIFSGFGDTGGELFGDTIGGLHVSSSETSMEGSAQDEYSASSPSEDVILFDFRRLVAFQEARDKAGRIDFASKTTLRRTAKPVATCNSAF